MKYYLAEYGWSANLAEFEGEKLGKTYKANKDTFRELYGMVFLPRSGRVVVGNNRFVTSEKNDAVRWLVLQINKKIEKMQRQIEMEYKPEIKSLTALYK